MYQNKRGIINKTQTIREHLGLLLTTPQDLKQTQGTHWNNIHQKKGLYNMNWTNLILGKED